MTITYTGSCLCGQLRYSALGDPKIVAQCHCEECRRTSGTGHAVGAMFAVSAVTFTGKTSTYSYTSHNGSSVSKAFCATCASPIYGTNSNSPEYLTLTLGSMDEATDLAVQVVIFARDKQHWDQLTSDVASFDTQPDWSPAN